MKTTDFQNVPYFYDVTCLIFLDSLESFTFFKCDKRKTVKNITMMTKIQCVNEVCHLGVARLKIRIGHIKVVCLVIDVFENCYYSKLSNFMYMPVLYITKVSLINQRSPNHAIIDKLMQSFFLQDMDIVSRSSHGNLPSTLVLDLL